MRPSPRTLIARLGALAFAALLLGSCSAEVITQKALIGAKCMSNAECGTQPWFICESTHPDGYCTKACRSDADCPPEAICAFDGGDGTCHVRCDNTQGCRTPKYFCHAASNDPDNFASHQYCEMVASGSDAGTPADMATKSDAGGGAGG